MLLREKIPTNGNLLPTPNQLLKKIIIKVFVYRFILIVINLSNLA